MFWSIDIGWTVNAKIMSSKSSFQAMTREISIEHILGCYVVRVSAQLTICGVFFLAFPSFVCDWNVAIPKMSDIENLLIKSR
jgi:hypothetical protein